MTVKIKVCGLRREQDVLDCIEAGVDAVGFNFWPGSRRYVSVGEARALIALLPRSIETVGVFVHATPREVGAAVRASGVRGAQLQGEQDPEPYLGLADVIIPVIRVRGRDSLGFARLHPAISRVMLDSWVKGYGGEGAPFDWSLAAEVPAGREVILAGGLSAANVAEAIRVAQPWGVDVESGVESAPGRKDRDKLRAFVEAVRAAASAVAVDR